MSITRVQQPELNVREYIARLDLNPENVYYQSIQAVNISIQNANWQITSPNKRAMLLDYAVADWRPTIERRRLDGLTAQDWGASYNKISFKECLPFANSMSSITCAINGNSLTLASPRRFMQQLTWACVTHEESHACFESGFPKDLGGHYPTLAPGTEARANRQDIGMLKNESSFTAKMFTGITQADDFAGYNAVTNPRQISYQEPLIVPPFNPFSKIKAGMPDYMWFKHMSDVIPNVDRIDLDVQFGQNLESGVLFPQYIQALANDELKRLAITALACNLKLWWYEAPVNMSIPKQVDLNTWEVREYITLTSLANLANGAAFNNVSSPLIQLSSVPTLIMISVRRIQENNNYICQALSKDTDGAGASGGITTNIHSLDSYAEITSLEVTLGDRPNVIGTQFTQHEAYYLTTKNSKYPYPFDYTNWKGKKEPILNVNGLFVSAADNYVRYSSRCSILLRPKDVAEKISTGVFAPNSLQITVSGRARDGFAGLGGGAQSYALYVHLFYGSHFLRLQPDRSQYQLQSLPLDEANRLLQPSLAPLGSDVGGRLAGMREAQQSRFGNGVRSRV